MKLSNYYLLCRRPKRTLAKEPGPAKKKADQIQTDRFINEVLTNLIYNI